MLVGARIELTARIDAMGFTAHPGEQGVIQELHTNGQYIVRMDNGRTQFPRRNEMTSPGSRDSQLLGRARAALAQLGEGPTAPGCPDGSDLNGWSTGTPEIDRTTLAWAAAFTLLADHQPDAWLLAHVAGADAVLREEGVRGIATLQSNLAGGAPVDHRFTRCAYCGGHGDDPTFPTCEERGCLPQYEFAGHDHGCPVCGGAMWEPDWYGEQQIRYCDGLLADALPPAPPGRLARLLRRA